MLFRELDIPDGLKDALESRGFREMYPPQEAALPVAVQGKSLVAAVPTASGKSLVGYIPILKTVIEKGKRALYIVPLKALATEKRDDLEKFRSLGIRTVALTGDPDRDDDVRDADIVVATSEKADSMIRHGNPWLDDIGVLVADEVHMINDPGRGPTLEIAMTKLIRRCRGLQVIALSATISNAEDLAYWLEAELVRSDWRPTKLKEGVYSEGSIRFGDGSDTKVPESKDPVAAMVMQTVQEGGQCLVFVNSRRSAESVARNLSKVMKPKCGFELPAPQRKILEGGQETTSMGRDLADSFSGGVAFHHAGLEYAQRRIVEDEFRARTLKCIVATPTLAAGINLPARRVIVRDTSRFESDKGSVPLPVMEIKQMCGRAGRPGYDPWGEAVLVAKTDRDTDRLMRNYIHHDTERLTSKLGNMDALRGHILSLIATEDAGTPGEIKDFMDSTFFGATSDTWGMEDVIEQILDYLEENKLVEGFGGTYRATPFGKKVSDLYVDPESAVILRSAVERMKEDALPIIILQAMASTPDMLGMFPKKNDTQFLQDLENTYMEEWLVPVEEESGGDMWMKVETHMANLKQAAVLHDWISEVSEDTITTRFGIGPGDIRMKVDTANWLLYAMGEIAYIFRPDVVRCIRQLGTRVKFGIKEELIPLVSLRGIGRSRARTLFQYSYRSKEDLGRATTDELASLPGIGRGIAVRIKEQCSGPVAPVVSSMDDEETMFMLEMMAAEEESKEQKDWFA